MHAQYIRLSVLFTLAIGFFLHPVVPALKLSASAYNAAVSCPQSIAVLLQSDPDDSLPSCPLNLHDYELFVRLARHASLFDDLEASENITLLMPPDTGINATAYEIAESLRRPLAKSEDDAFDLILALMDEYEHPVQVLRDVLRFHILIGIKTRDDITEGTDTSFQTLFDRHRIIREGTCLGAEQPPGPTELFVKGCLVIDIEHVTEVGASNGIILSLERMVLPDMSLFKRATSSPEANSPASQPPALSPSLTASSRPSKDQSPSPAITTITAQPSSSPLPPTTPGPTNRSPSPSISPSPSTPSRDNRPECFPASARVILDDGRQIPLSYLAAGDAVQATESQLSSVYLFTHRQYSGLRHFIRIVSQNNHSIVLSQGHYIYASGKLKAAYHVQVGDVLRTLDGPAVVTSVQWTEEYGLFAPHTIHGDIVVNRVVTSTYTTAVHPVLAHAALWPLRALTRTGMLSEPMRDLLYSTHPLLPTLLPRGGVSF